MARLPVLIRRSKVFDLVVDGKSYEQICKQLSISEDTLARDLKAVTDEIETLVRERHGEILAMAIAQYGDIIAEAWAEYRLEAKREKDWFAGKLDYPTVDQSSKETALAEGGPRLGRKRKGQDAEADEEDRAESPGVVVETVTKISSVRPSWRSDRAKWLQLVFTATREITELTGIKKIIMEHQGKGGGPIEFTDPVRNAAEKRLAEWRSKMKPELLNSPPAPSTPLISPMNTD